MKISPRRKSDRDCITFKLRLKRAVDGGQLVLVVVLKKRWLSVSSFPFRSYEKLLVTGRELRRTFEMTGCHSLSLNARSFSLRKLLRRIPNASGEGDCSKHAVNSRFLVSAHG